MRRHEFASVLHAHLLNVLAQYESASLNQAMAAQVASQVVTQITSTYHGERVYLGPPKYDAEDVRRDFNYRNVGEVCRRYNISRRTLYRIMAAS